MNNISAINHVKSQINLLNRLIKRTEESEKRYPGLPYFKMEKINFEILKEEYEKQLLKLERGV